jgi:hypothetical protein
MGEVDTAMTTTHILETAEVDIAYDVDCPLPTADGRPPLVMIGQPMDASGFAFTDDYFAQPAPDPVLVGMPSEDDGTRDDPLLSDRSWAVSSYRPDVNRLAAAPTRIVIAVGEESLGTFTGRTSVATAELLGQQATVFPSHHGGFLGGEFGYAGQPEAFARKLRDVLDHDN